MSTEGMRYKQKDRAIPMTTAYERMFEDEFGVKLAISDDALDWQVSAACKGSDANLFFPERGASTRVAKAICRECAVRDECLDFAIDTGEKFGIWGGMSERERRRVKSERQVEANRRGK